MFPGYPTSWRAHTNPDVQWPPDPATRAVPASRPMWCRTCGNSPMIRPTAPTTVCHSAWILPRMPGPAGTAPPRAPAPRCMWWEEWSAVTAILLTPGIPGAVPGRCRTVQARRDPEHFTAYDLCPSGGACHCCPQCDAASSTPQGPKLPTRPGRLTGVKRNPPQARCTGQRPAIGPIVLNINVVREGGPMTEPACAPAVATLRRAGLPAAVPAPMTGSSACVF